MEQQPQTRAVFSWFGFIFGACALIGVVVVFYAGPFAPQAPVGVSLGDMAGEIVASAKRKALGQSQPMAEPRTRDLDDLVQIGLSALGALAVIIGLAGLLRGERRAVAVAAVGLGIGATLLQFFFWLAIALIGVFLIMALLSSLEGVLAGIFGG